MTLRVREGEFYRRRDGVKAGPLVSHMPNEKGLEWIDQRFEFTYYQDGTHCGNPTCQFDLIAEWTEPEAGPVRTETVTRLVIVPGAYDGFSVGASDQGRVHLVQGNQEMFSAPELRALGRLANSLAEALEWQP